MPKIRTNRWGALIGWLILLLYAGWLVHNALPWFNGTPAPAFGELLLRLIAFPVLPQAVEALAPPPYVQLLESVLPQFVAAAMGFLLVIKIALSLPSQPQAPELTPAGTVGEPTRGEAEAQVASADAAPFVTQAQAEVDTPSTEADTPEAQFPAESSGILASVIALPVADGVTVESAVGAPPVPEPATAEAIQDAVTQLAPSVDASASKAAPSTPGASDDRDVAEAPSAPDAHQTPEAPRAPEVYTPKVFISHSSKDDAFGQRLVAELRAELAPDDPTVIWYDQRPERALLDESEWDDPGGLEVGQNFVREIVAQIQARNACVVILSPDAVSSRWVAYEIDQCVRRYNGPMPFRIYPVYCRPSRLPDELAIFHTLDLSQEFTDPTQYEINLKTLIARLRSGAIALSEAPPLFELGVLPLPKPFVGRTEELDWALHRLRQGRITEVTALRGLGGIGKSALAAVAIQQLYEERAFPDGIAVVLCEGLTDPVEVLQRALEPFLPGRQRPAARELTALSAIANQHLRGERVLIVLDSIEPGWPIERVTKILVAAGATLLLTARQTLSEDAVPLEGVKELGLLSFDEALQLFAQSYGRAGVSALTDDERAQATRIVKLLDRHTLAVKLAGAYAASPPRPLETVAAELEADLLILPKGETPREVEAVLGRSVAALPESDQRVFAALYAFSQPDLNDRREPGPIEFGRQALLALARAFGVEDERASADLLVRRALVEALPSVDLPLTADRERRRLHALVQAATKKRFRQLTTTERRLAQQALATHYADYADRVGRDLTSAIALDQDNIIRKFVWAADQSDDLLAALLCSGLMEYWLDAAAAQMVLRYVPKGVAAAERRARATEATSDAQRANALKVAYGDALRMTDQMTEAEQVLASALQGSREAEDKRTEGLALNVLGLLQAQRADWATALQHQTQALVCFREVGDRRHEGEAERHLGEVLSEGYQEWDVADTHFQRAIAIAQEVTDLIGEGSARCSQGDSAMAQKRWEEAERYFQQGLTLYRASGSRFGVGRALWALGELAMRQERWETATDYFQQLLAVTREQGDRQRESVALVRLGDVAVRQEQWEAAVTYFGQALAIEKERDDRARQSLILTRLGDVAVKQELWEAAGDHFKQALALDREIGDRAGEGVDLGRLGQVAQQQERWEEATDYFEQWLGLAREQGDRQGASAILTQLGDIAVGQERWMAAEDHFKQALALDREIGDRAGEGVDLTRLGEVAVRQERWAVAADYFEQWLALAREQGDRQRESVALVWLGDVAVGQERPDAARGYFEQALAVEREREDQPRQALILRRLGQVAQQQERWAEAGNYFERLQTLERERGDRQQESVALVWLGDVAVKQKQWEAAQGYFEQALAVEREREDQPRQALVLTRLGQVVLKRQRWAEAESYLQQLLSIEREGGDRQRASVILTQLGDIAVGQERWMAAEDHFKQALALDREIGDRAGEGVDLTRLGEVAVRQERWAVAADYFEQALTIDREREQGDRQGESVALVWLGDVAVKQKQWEAAASSFEQALAIERERSDKARQALILTRLGEVAREQARWVEAEDYFQQAVALYRELGDRAGEGRILSLLGKVALGTKTVDAAEGYFDEALRIQREMGDQVEEGVTLSGMAQAAEEQGQLERAEQLHRESLELAVRTNDAVGVADEWRILGAFLLKHGRGRDEGEALLRKAVERFRELNMESDASEAIEQAAKLGVVIDP